MKRRLAQWMRRKADKLDPQPPFALVHEVLTTASSSGSYSITLPPRGKPA